MRVGRRTVSTVDSARRNGAEGHRRSEALSSSRHLEVSQLEQPGQRREVDKGTKALDRESLPLSELFQWPHVAHCAGPPKLKVAKPVIDDATGVAGGLRSVQLRTRDG